MRRAIRKPALLAFACSLLALSTATSAQEGPPAPVSIETQPVSSSTSGAVVAPRVRPAITPGPSLTLAEAFDRARKSNLSLESARLEIDKARAQLKQSWGLVLPMLQGGLQYTHMDHEDTLDLAGSMAPLLDAMGITLPPGAAGKPLLLNPQEKLQGSLQAAVSVVDPKSWLTIHAAKKGVEVAELSIEDGERQLLLGVAQAYYMTLMTRELIDLYTTQLDAAEAQLAVAQARFRAEAGRRIDVVRAETDVEETYQDLVTAHLAFDNTRDALGDLAQIDGLPLPENAPPLTAPAGTDEEMARRVESKRTDLRAGQAKIELQERLLDAAWMQFVPSLAAAWQGSYTFTDMPDMGSDDRSRWAFVLTLTVPIYNHFRYGDLDYRRAALQQSIIELENIKDEASLAIRMAARDYRSALLSIETAERQFALAGEGLALAEAAYKAGAATSLEVTEARKAHTSAGVNLATLRLRSQIALLSLLDAAGDELLPSDREGRE
jgi:outer membrane protein TolC